jgi:hypothetical protein
MRMVHSPEAAMHRREAAVLDKEVPGQGQWREPGRAWECERGRGEDQKLANDPPSRRNW